METNSNLVEYGIFEEQSDIRAHVSDRVVYVFRTPLVIQAIQSKTYRLANATQPGVEQITAEGYLVPPTDISDCRICHNNSWPYWDYFQGSWPTDKKGRWAVACVVDMLRVGLFPLWLETKQTDDVILDIAGTDILISANQRIQVKCDYPASKTGNLYIQTKESNPLSIY